MATVDNSKSDNNLVGDMFLRPDQLESLKMVKVNVNDSCYYLDGYLKHNLDQIKKDSKKDYDTFIVIDGKERLGKSTLAGQVAYYLDPTYNLSRCCFTAKQFIDCVKAAPKKSHQAIVFDEAHGYLASRSATSKFNKILIKVMAEMGFKNLFIIICIPSFFELDKYPAIHRSLGLLHVYKRGFLACYNYHRKKILYFKGKKFYTYAVPPNFVGRFTKFSPLNKEEYETRKEQYILQDVDQK